MDDPDDTTSDDNDDEADVAPAAIVPVLPPFAADEFDDEDDEDDEADAAPAAIVPVPRPFAADELDDDDANHRSASLEASFLESILKRFLGYKQKGERPPKAKEWVKLFELSTEEADNRGIARGDIQRAKQFCTDLAATNFTTLWPDFSCPPPTCVGTAWVAAVRVTPKPTEGDHEVELVPNLPSHRWSWDELEKRVKDRKKGGWKLKRPFLKNNNWKDILFVRKLLVETPFQAAHGEKTKSWEDFADGMKDEVSPTGIQPYKDFDVCAKTLRKRFDAYMAFVKKYQGHIPFQSGQDDEKPPMELLQGLEDLYEMYTSFQDEQDEKDMDSAAQKKLDRQKADAIKMASLDSMRGRAQAKAIMAQEGGKENADKTNESAAGSGKKKKKFDYDAFMLETQEQMKDEVAARTEREKERAERKRRKLVLQEENQRIEREKFELDKKEREAQLELLKALTSKLG